MGVVENVGFDTFPKQGRFKGKFVRVYFDYDTTRYLTGRVLRDDAENPNETIFQLEDGRVIRSTECQYSVQIASPTPNTGLCDYCGASMPGPCQHQDPCPAWEDYKEANERKPENDKDLELNIFEFLTEKYVQRADARQKEMGLQYTEAETHDLAKEFARFLRRQES